MGPQHRRWFGAGSPAGEEAAVKRVIEWARLGPPRATVSTLTEERLDSHPHQVGFRIVE
jgi:hypothetical protein